MGSESLPAPQAQALATTIESIVSGNVPAYRYTAGAGMGLMLALSGLGGIGVLVGLGFYMPFHNAAIAGQILLWIGFLGGALAAVFRLENAEAPWQTIPWILYLACAAVGVVGVVVLRKDRAAHRLMSASSEAGMESITENLQQVAKKVAAYSARIEDATCEQVLQFIDEECAPVLAEFADGRMVVANRFGTAVYAAVMTEFASGERYLNRAWSAAADGYVDEVADSVRISSDFLTAAHQQLQDALSKASSGQNSVVQERMPQSL